MFGRAPMQGPEGVAWAETGFALVSDNGVVGNRLALDAYEGFVVESLDAGWGEVRFANGLVVEAGEERGPDHELIAQVQIGHTIEEHMRKAHRLRKRGLKVLSLFFIDEVANYTDPDGTIRRAFEEAFDRLKERD